MKVILFMAISLNGIIAREDHSEDFLSDENWKSHMELCQRTGCMVWGRQTQEVVKTWVQNYHDEVKGFRKVVVSSDESYDPGEGYTRVSSPIEALKLLSDEGFNEVVLVGGAHLNSSFAKENLIDEIFINVEPAVVGKGIPLFYSDDFDLRLKLVDSKKVTDDIIQLHYLVNK